MMYEMRCLVYKGKKKKMKNNRGSNKDFRNG